MMTLLFQICAPDFKFVQDGTRIDGAFRNMQYQWYLQQLHQRKINYCLLTGNLEKREKKILDIIGAFK